MLTAGRLTERVDVFMPGVTRGAMGEQRVTYEKAATVWANVAFQRGQYALTVGEGWMMRTVTVTMRNNNVVTERCRLKWDGKTYGIESMNRSGSDGSITIVAVVLDEKE